MCIDIFPYSTVSDDEFKFINSDMNVNAAIYNIYDQCSVFGFKSFSMSEYNCGDFECDIDPNNNFFNTISTRCDYYTVEQFVKSENIQKGLSFIHFNARSLKANFDKIRDYITELNTPFDIIAISETWLDSEDCSDILLNGYDVIYRNRNNKKGGGVAIYVNVSIEFKVIQTMSMVIDDVLECITVELRIGNMKNIIVSCIYRAPGTNIDMFTDQLESMIKTVRNTNKTIFICGDFNIDLLKYNTNNGTTHFVDMLFSLGIYPLIDKPSRITDHSATLIDNIFTNELNNSITSGLLITDISDHLPVFCVCNCSHINRITVNKYRCIRKLSDDCIKSFNSDLSAVNWDTVLNESDADIAYTNFMDIFTSLYDKNCPIKKICMNTPTSKSKPWFNRGLRNACKKKNNLYKQFLRHRTTKSKCKYSTYKNKLTSILRFCEKEYYNKLLVKEKYNVKGTWKILNSIIKKRQLQSCYPNSFISNGRLTRNTTDIVNGFNDFFVNVGPNLAKNIRVPNGNTSVLDFLQNTNTNTMFLPGVEEQEVMNIVNGCKNKKSTGYDNVDMIIVKKVISNVVIPFTHICNKSFSSGVFPSKMKIAKVIPIFKAGEKNVFTNYRPVSLLPQFSKLLEKLFNSRLDKFIEKYDILNSSQYGFRTKMSTSMALLELTENITAALDQKNCTIGVFIDLKKAFDTIDHNLLLRKLEAYGIRGMASEWLKSYLYNRLQYVSIDDCNSDLLQVLCGVPQGSILGPKLFILYINDICNCSDILKFILFADDTNIFCSGKDPAQLSKIVSDELQKLHIWFSVNKLSLNVAKTNYMLFTNYSKTTNIDIKIDNTTIDRVYVTKFLGVLIDDKLSWKDHINMIKSKLTKTIAIIYRAKYLLDKKSLFILYCSLFLPYLSYCCEVWGNAYTTYINGVYILQKKVVRIICKKNPLSHTNTLFYDLRILKLYDLIKLNISIVMFKANNKLLPDNLQFFFNAKYTTPYVTRQRNKLKHVYARTTLKAKCISVYGIKLWNCLDEHIKRSLTVRNLKKQYKNYLIEEYKSCN